MLFWVFVSAGVPVVSVLVSTVEYDSASHLETMITVFVAFKALCRPFAAVTD